MRPTLPHLTGWVLAAAVAVTAAAAAGQSGPRKPVLHEYFDPWNLGITTVSGDQPDRSSDADASDADAAADNAVAGAGGPPNLSVNPGDREVIFGADGPVDPALTSPAYGPLDPEHHASPLDAATDQVDQLDYYSNFEPSVVPYKRAVVQNAVRHDGRDYQLTVQSSGFEPVGVVSGPPRADEDVFWGSFLFRAQAGQRHPMASVAPNQRILEVQAEPDIAVDFVRDAADNFYVVPPKDGLIRLNIRVAAPKRYFGGPMPAAVRWQEFGRPRPALPAAVEPVADKVLARVGVSRAMAPLDALDRLVEYYRNFEGRPFPDELAGKDLYASISRAQIGVCRHRSLAFVISARALGIRARYVYNEAHAFVEVRWPKLGWRRIDLGGRAGQLDASGRSGGSVHRAPKDRFPKPAHYTQRPDQNRAGDAPGRPGQPSGASGPPASTTTGANASQSNATQPSAAQPSAAQPSAAQPSAAQPSAAQPNAAQPNAAQPNAAQPNAAQPSAPPADAAVDEREVVNLDVHVEAASVFRGKPFGVSGHMRTAAGQPVGGQSIHVMLGPVGANSAQTRIELDTFETGPDGRFSGQITLPERISIGRWSLVVQFRGNQQLQPARAH